jgi:hypothetical protein
MELYLAKTLENMKLYGPTYDLTMESEDRVESFKFGSGESEWLINNLVDMINAECNTLLDDGDYDFIDAHGCEILLKCLGKFNLANSSKEVEELIKKMKEFATRAVELNTGIAIDL